MWEGQLPKPRAEFFAELRLEAALATRKAERLIYSRNAKKGMGK